MHQGEDASSDAAQGATADADALKGNSNGEKTTESRIHRWVGWPRWLADFVKEQWSSVLFSAALALIFDHLGILTSLSKLSLLLVSNMASVHVAQRPEFNHGPYVFAITQADFQDRYRERSPLDHCLVADDLNLLYARHPAQLGIDIDLSPLPRATPAEQACQAHLDALLDAQAAHTVLIMPFPVTSQQLRDVEIDWLHKRCVSGVRFAGAYLQRALRMVIDQSRHPIESMAYLIAHPGNNPLCRQLHSDPATLARTWLDDETAYAAHQDPPEDRQPINFSAAVVTVPGPIAISSPTDTWPRLDGRVVFFGGSYGRDDNYATPIGKQPGVWIHAARLVTLKHPIQAFHPVVALLIDVAIGFAFGILIGAFWKIYIANRLVEVEVARESKGEARPQAWSSAALLAFLVAFLVLTLSFFFIARYLFVARGILIYPLLMALGMLTDGFISGPIEELTDVAVSGYLGLSSVKNPSERRRDRAWAGVALLGVMLAAAGLLMLLVMASNPGAWLTVIVLVLLATLVALVVLGFVRNRKKESGEPDVSTPPTIVRDPGVHGMVSFIGQGLQLLRGSVFWGVLGYAAYILFT